MTIKVVSRGTKPEDVIYTCTCNSCKSVLEFSSSDAPYSGNYRDGGYTLKCPVCNRQIYLSTLTKKTAMHTSSDGYWATQYDR